MQAKRPKLGLGILQEIQHQSAAAEDQGGERMALTQESAGQLFADFKDYVRNELKQLPLAAQLDMMSIKCISENELQLICTSDMNMIYAQNQREPFMDFGKQRTRISDLRVMVIQDTSARKEAPRERVLTKLEIYELMAAQNPALKALRDSLNLQIDF